LSRLLLVRHGEIATDNTEKFWGHTDIALNETGVLQVERLGERLSGEPIDEIYSSDLSRASHSAEIIAARHGLNITTSEKLREIHFGDIEGLTFEEIDRQYPELSKSWSDDDLTFRFPNGESFTELEERVRGFIAEIDSHNRDCTILIVSHGGLLRMLICHVLGLNLKHWKQLCLDKASLSILDTYPGTALLSLLNDVSHLQ
jgi:alpha-ribazole phosphatase